ncbi:MAG: hypothetical protein JXA53_01020 [Bacteroidales bacterium]|nr:hypothetical protein [Bacteroidales bacterium]
MKFNFYIAFFAFLFFNVNTFAQQIDSVNIGANNVVDVYAKDSLTGKKNNEITKIDTIIKPMAIFTELSEKYKDSLLFKWKYNAHDLMVSDEFVDTTIINSSFNIPGRANQSFYHDLGNMGSPQEDGFFFHRNTSEQFFVVPYYNQLKSIDKVEFFNTKRPYSEFSYSSRGGKRVKGQTVSIKHTQNITPDLNFGVDYDVISSIGYYARQKTKSERFGSNLSYVKENYRAHFAYNFNKFSNQENGGIVNDRFITDTVVDRSENIPVNLSEALSLTKCSDIVLSQSYILSRKKEKLTDSLYVLEKEPLFDFGYTFGFKKSGRKYTDKKGTDETFYSNQFLNKAESVDSMGVKTLYHRLKIQIYGDSYGIPMRASIIGGVDNDKYYNFTSDSYLSGNNAYSSSGMFLKGAVSFPYKQFLANFSGKINAGGLRAGDTEWNGRLRWNFNLLNTDWETQVKANVATKSADLYYQQYSSNHFKWNNNFDRENTINIYGSVKSDKLKFMVSGYYSQIDGFMFFDAKGPNQFDSSLGVFGFRAKKNFALGIFRADILGDVQISSDESVLSLPLLSTTTRLYIDTFLDFPTTKGHMDLQFGVETMFATEYYAPAYNPAIGVFYNQREKKFGNYPWVDAFLNVKVKRLVFYMKYSHFNNFFSPDNYFSTLHNPTPKATLTYGFIWRFYN